MKSDHYYDGLVLREVIKEVFFNMLSIRESYQWRCGNFGMRRDLALKWVEIQLITLFPITPHFSEVMWNEHFYPIDNSKPEFVSHCIYPEVKYEDIDRTVLKKSQYLVKIGKNLRSTYTKFIKKKKV